MPEGGQEAPFDAKVARFACVVDDASPAALRLMRLTGTHDLLRGFAAAPLAGGAPV